MLSHNGADMRSCTTKGSAIWVKRLKGAEPHIGFCAMDCAIIASLLLYSEEKKEKHP